MGILYRFCNAACSGEVVYSKHLEESVTASGGSFYCIIVHVTGRHLSQHAKPRFTACTCGNSLLQCIRVHRYRLHRTGIAECMHHWVEFGRHHLLYETLAFISGTVGSYLLPVNGHRLLWAPVGVFRYALVSVVYCEYLWASFIASCKYIHCTVIPIESGNRISPIVPDKFSDNRQSLGIKRK